MNVEKYVEKNGKVGVTGNIILTKCEDFGFGIFYICMENDKEQTLFFVNDHGRKYYYSSIKGDEIIDTQLSWFGYGYLMEKKKELENSK